jgi:quercetin dioxygenase-like cupin family protein
MKIRLLAVTAAMLWNGSAGLAADTPKAIAHAKDATVTPLAVWTEGGTQKTARGNDVKNAPKTAAFLESTVLQLGDHSIRRVVVRAGSLITNPGPSSDVLVYILKGRVKVTIGDQTDIIGPGDAMRELTGVPLSFEALEEVTTVETNLPPKPKP